MAALAQAGDLAQGEPLAPAPGLGVRGARSELLASYYSESSIEIKGQLLQALYVDEDIEALAGVAKDRAEPEELRLSAIHWLGVRKEYEPLWAIYSTESSSEVRRGIRHAVFLREREDDLKRLILDPSTEGRVRLAAIVKLGDTQGPHSGPVLVEIYGRLSELYLKAEVLRALAARPENAASLASIADQEADPELLREAEHLLIRKGVSR